MKPTIEYSDFERLEVRVGRVVEANEPEWSLKLIKLKVDFGQELGARTILSGIRKWHRASQLINKKFMFVVNLAAKPMGEEISQGMMLMALTTNQPEMIEVPETVLEGTEIG